MAYTATVTKVKPDQHKNKNDYNMSFRVVILDDDPNRTVFDGVITEPYHDQDQVGVIEDNLEAQIKKIIDTYKAEKAMENSAGFETVRASLEAKTTAYLNQ